MNAVISILMPVYNASKFLSYTIESVLMQSLRNFEFIIIDDGSSDRTVEIVNHFFDERIKFVKRKHQGLSATLNYGLRIANCDLIARMDSDDIWEKDKLKIQYEFLKKNSEYKLIGTNCSFINDTGNLIFEKKYPEFHEQIVDQISYYNPMCHPSIMFYKNIVLDLGGYNTDMEPIEDYDLYVRLFDQGFKAYNIQKSLVKYRIHKLSASSNQMLKQKRFMKNVTSNYVAKHFKKKDHEYFYRLGLIEYYYGDLKKARLFFIKSILIHDFLKKKRILRYLFLSLAGDRILNKFRTSKYFFMLKRNIPILNKYNFTQT